MTFRKTLLRDGIVLSLVFLGIFWMRSLEEAEHKAPCFGMECAQR